MPPTSGEPLTTSLEGTTMILARLRARRLVTLILAAAFVVTACGGGRAATSSAASAATSAPSAAADPSPSLSPPTLPGGRLVYGQWIGDVGSLFTSNPDGTDITPLLPTGTGEQPRWSPDGRHISIVAENGDGLVFVGLIDPDGSHYVQFDSPDPTLNLGCFDWSPDGSRLACEGWDDTDLSRNGIYTVRSSDGGDLARVTTSPDGAHDIPTDYSPDGHQIVFIRGKPGDEANSTLMVVDVDGSGARALSDQNLRQGRWSPDGKTILSGAGVEAEKLLLVPIDGGEIRTIEILSDDSPKTAFFASWSPDGEWIVFSGRTSNDVDLFIVRVDGTRLHQVTDTPGKYEDAAGWTAAAP
jgi:Tol biopolymer transport system component